MKQFGLREMFFITYRVVNADWHQKNDITANLWGQKEKKTV